MIKSIIILAVFASMAFSGIAKNIYIELDGAQFRYNDNRTIWEVYYCFADTSLAYQRFETEYRGELLFKITFSSSVKELYSEEWSAVNIVESVPKYFEMNIIGTKSFILPPGQYKTDLLVYDKNDTTTVAQRSFDLLVRDFSTSDKIIVSDIELANTLDYTENQDLLNGPFGKSAFYVVPNPSLEFSGIDPVLRAYFEIYNAQTVSPNGFFVEYSIYDGAKNIVFRYETAKQSISDAIIETPDISISFFPTGVYFFQVKVSYGEEENKNQVVSPIKKFFVINPNAPPSLETGFTENIDFEASYWATLEDKELDIEFKKAEPLAIALEIDQFKMLQSVEAKRRFMFRFWKMRDPDTTTAINEKLEEHRRLINYANTFFSFGKMRDGWNTDRGRILLRYGEPTQVEQNPSNKDMRAYDIWYYDHIEGGVKFYFVDYTGFNNYIQVHSDAIGHPRNYDWYKQYVPMFDQGLQNNYFQNR